jgi:hypothetical protein
VVVVIITDRTPDARVNHQLPGHIERAGAVPVAVILSSRASTSAWSIATDDDAVGQLNGLDHVVGPR